MWQLNVLSLFAGPSRTDDIERQLGQLCMQNDVALAFKAFDILRAAARDLS